MHLLNLMYSHLKLPKIVKVSLIKGKAKFTVCYLLFKNLNFCDVSFEVCILCGNYH